MRLCRDRAERPGSGGQDAASLRDDCYELTNYLSLDRIILDKTGIQGLFDIEVTYGADVSPMGNRCPGRISSRRRYSDPDSACSVGC
jgi:hypothetical protein